MGVIGLFFFLKKIYVFVNVVKFEGCIVVIDVYCWFYKGVFFCVEKLVIGEFID